MRGEALAAAEMPPPIGEVCEEFRLFAQETLRRELEDFAMRLQKNVCEELKRFVSSPARGPPADVASEVSKRSGADPPTESLDPVPGQVPQKLRTQVSQTLLASQNTESLSSMKLDDTPRGGGTPTQQDWCAVVDLPAGYGSLPDLAQSCSLTVDPPPGTPNSCMTGEGAARRSSETAMDDVVIVPGNRCSASSSRRRRSDSPSLLPDDVSPSKDTQYPRLLSRMTEECSLTLPGFRSAKRKNAPGGHRRSSPMNARSRNGSAGDLEQLPTFIGFKKETVRSLSRSGSLEQSPGNFSAKKGSLMRSASRSSECLNLPGRVELVQESPGGEKEPPEDEVDGGSQAPQLPQGPSAASLVSSLAEGCLEKARTWIHKGVSTSKFDWISGLLVLVNATGIGLQTDYMAQHATDHVPSAFRFLDGLFCLVFIIELGMRMVAHGQEFITGVEWRWNAFDTIMVVLQILEEVTTLAALSSDDGPSDTTGSNFTYMRLLRFVRLVRVLRIVRVLRFVGELRKLVCSIGNSLQSLAWTLVLLIFMLYIVGICFTQLVYNHIRLEPDSNPDLAVFFGSLGMSVLSLFQAMTGGVDWNDLCRPLMTIHWTMSLLLSLYISFAVLAVMNVVTGVFVDSAVQSSKKDQENEFLLRMREFYERTNLDDFGGQLTWGAFEHQLRKQEVAEFFQNVGINVTEAKSLFELLDVNDDGEIDADEFVMGCVRLRGPAKSVDLVTLMYDNKRMLGRLQAQCEDALRLLQVCQPLSPLPGRATPLVGSSQQQACAQKCAAT